jgi:hypothetical protein
MMIDVHTQCQFRRMIVISVPFSLLDRHPPLDQGSSQMR